MRNLIFIVALGAIALAPLAGCGEAKEKTIEGLMSQIEKVDLGGLQKMADGASAEVKGKVTPLLGELKGKKDLAMNAINALKNAGEGKWTDLLKKAKDSLGDVTTLYDKIKGMLGK